MTDTQVDFQTRGMAVESPTFGPMHLTWQNKHGVWFLINAHQSGISCLHLFREIQTDIGFKAWCRRSGSTFRWI